jgi:hypothetical protein
MNDGGGGDRLAWLQQVGQEGRRRIPKELGPENLNAGWVRRKCQKYSTLLAMRKFAPNPRSDSISFSVVSVLSMPYAYAPNMSPARTPSAK